MIKAEEYTKTPILKRFFDVVGTGVILLLSAPLMSVFFLALLIEQMTSPVTRGPVLYCEPRVSGGKRILFCKIRTVKQAVIDDLRKREGFVHTIELEKNSANSLFVGRLIKKLYLDEWPQFFSVLRGDMSLVGPRPANLVNYKKLQDAGIYTKSAIKSGLTGYFQSYKGHHNRTDVEMDTEYIEFCRTHNSWQILWFDLGVIIRTILRVFEHKGL